jgi:hypothetical protein
MPVGSKREEILKSDTIFLFSCYYSLVLLSTDLEGSEGYKIIDREYVVLPPAAAPAPAAGSLLSL